MRGTIDFVLNGERMSLPAADGARTVLTWLREERRLTGTKEGCAEGDCGACTAVLTERRPTGKSVHLPVNTCILFVGALDGKALTTVEALKGAHPVQRAMVECHGSQCGFCTPGFVMALYAHYRGSRSAERADLCDALAGNLCRCTGYAPILAAGARMFDYPTPGETEPALAELPQEGVQSERFSAPRTLGDLLAVLDERATLLGGGTDLGLVVTKAHRDLDRIVYLGNVGELKSITDHPNHIEIGGAVTYAEAQPALARLHPDIGELLRRLGGAQVRACGTIAGNIANASPIGDTMPVLLALDAMLVLQKGTETRQARLARFYTGYRQSVLLPGEFIRSVQIPKLKPGARFAAYKLSKRFDQDISSVCAAFHIDAGKARFGFGGMAATPARARHAEAAYARGIEAACAALAEDFSPISDQRASAWYRIRAAQGLLRKFHAGTNARALLEIAP
jgi:xanthine dehydrogenase small subunit